MTLPSLVTLCQPLPGTPPELCVTLPGGAEICAQPGVLPPSLFGYAKNALAQASSALTPLVPIFNIIEAISAVLQCVKAVPDALGPPPDPSGIIACIPNLVEKVEKLIALLPPVSVLLTIVQMLDVIIAIIDGSIEELQAVERLIQRIAAAEAMSAQVPGLLSMIECANASRDSSMENIERAFGSINPIIELINTLCSMAGLPAVPLFSGSLPADPLPAIEVLGGISDVLHAIRDAVPV